MRAWHDSPNETMVVVAAKVSQTTAAKLERLAKETRRSRSQVIRLLIERATISDLDVRRAREAAVAD